MNLPQNDIRLAVLRRSPYADGLQRFLHANEFEIRQCKPIGNNPRSLDLALVLGLTPKHRHLYGFEGDGILALALARHEQEAWYRTAAETMMEDANAYRLTQHAVLIFSPDPDISRKCKEVLIAGKPTARVFVPIMTAELEVTAPEELQHVLFRALAVHGFSTDHFEFRNPVPSDLFGRERFVAKLDADLRSLDHGIALLGTRRVGKTSILQNVIDRLKVSSSEKWYVGFYDAQPDGSEARNRALRDLYDTLARAAREQGLSPPGLNSGTTLHELTRFIIAGDNDARILLAIDELEHLVPDMSTPSTEQVEGFIKVFGMLRRIKQEFGPRISVLVCGTNETFCDVPSFLRSTNPVAAWFSPFYVTPLSESDVRNMLVTLGRRMGITFDDAFLAGTYADFGGHPFLARQFCSVAARDLNRPGHLDIKAFTAAIRRFERDAAKIFKMVLDQLRFFYPTEFDALVAISTSAGAPLPSIDVEHLLNYGLVREVSAHRYEITMSALARFLAKNSASVAGRRFNEVKPLGAGGQG